jgi:hypothetical protein
MKRSVAGIWLARVLMTLFAVLCSPLTADAQDAPEYKLELGAGAGTVTYLGDLNGNLFRGVQPWLAAVTKLKMNPRMALALTLGYGKLKGNSDNAGTWYPMERYEFDSEAIELGLRYEYNFWPYGTGREYRGARRFTPFITLGLGGLYHGGNEKGITADIPLGAGVKYKLGERLNLAAEWRMHFALGDKLDGLKDPYGIQSSGMFKNTDCLSIIQVSLTYDLWEKCSTCHSDRD